MITNNNKIHCSKVFLAISVFLFFSLNGCSRVAELRLSINSYNSFAQLGTISIKHKKPRVITVMVIRHAERANDALTVDGEKRAETLARLLSNPGVSAIFSTNTTRTIETVKGDDFLSENHINKIDLLKIDTEGSEMEVLKGFEKSIDNKIIRAVQFEYGYINFRCLRSIIRSPSD